MNSINRCHTHPTWPFTSILTLSAPPNECKLFFLAILCSTNLFIHTPVSACWLNQLHFVLSCNLQLPLFSNYYTKFIKIVSLTALYLIYESIKSFISCLSKTGTLKSVKSLRKEG